MNDLAFIRLEPNFEDAKYLRTSSVANIFFYGQVILKPNSSYLQTTNTKLGIAFDGNYQVLVIDCDGVTLKDITLNVAISEFLSNGIPQISFEIINIDQDFYAKSVYLKFRHTVSNYVWYSNPINITNYFDNLASRFDYKNATDALYQSIDLKCYFSTNDGEDISKEYTTYVGRKNTSRLINTELENYIFDKVDNFTYRRLNGLLRNDVVYINGNRITTKQTLPSKPRSADTNTFNLEFSVPIDYNETFEYTPQIFEPLQLEIKIPSGVYTLATLPTIIEGTFNRNIVLNTGNVYLYKHGELFITFSYLDIVVLDNVFTIDTTGIIVDNDAYFIEIDAGLFTSVFAEVYQGITNTTEWEFTVSDGEFDNTEFDNTEFLTN